MKVLFIWIDLGSGFITYWQKIKNNTIETLRGDL